MKTKLVLIAVMCLWFLVSAIFAQQTFDQDYYRDQLQKNGDRALNRATWNGSLSTTLGRLNSPEFREAWNVSDEQYLQIRAIKYGENGGLSEVNAYRESLEYHEHLEVQREIARSARYQNADGKTKADMILESEEKRFAHIRNLKENAINNLLTAEQKQKIREFELVNMSNWQFTSFHSFEAFDLTDAQKQELEALKKEFEPEFERQLEDFVNREDLDNQMYRMVKAEYERQTGIDLEVFQNLRDFRMTRYDALRAKMLAENTEFRRMHERMTAERELFAVQFKTKMFDVLTDEQWDRLQGLLDNPPDYIKAWRNRIKEAEEAAQRAGTWVPGPGSWQPGDAIPIQYRQERETRGRFPRGEN